MKGRKQNKIRVLFVDENNDLASQIAEHFTRKYFEEMYEAYSAGPKHDMIDCELISVMYEEGEDMRRQISKDFRDQDNLPADAVFDIVVYFSKDTFDEWSGKTPWKGRQILQDMGSRKDFVATDDLELAQCYSEYIRKIKKWVEDNMGDAEGLRSLVIA
jgi:protein-tyrosine-phosphatase